MHTYFENLKVARCKIIDAVFRDNVVNGGEATDGENGYRCWIELTLKEIDTGIKFSSIWTVEDLQSKMQVPRPLSSREMIKFADDLKNREHPITLLVDPQQEMVTPDMVATHEQMENGTILAPPVAEIVQKFGFKKQKG